MPSTFCCMLLLVNLPSYFPISHKYLLFLSGNKCSEKLLHVITEVNWLTEERRFVHHPCLDFLQNQIKNFL